MQCKYIQRDVATCLDVAARVMSIVFIYDDDNDDDGRASSILSQIPAGAYAECAVYM